MTRASGYTKPRGWAKTKTRILKRDAHVCYICRRPDADQVDHVIPVHLGGAHDDSNLAAIHSWPCHHAKSQREANTSPKRNYATAKRPAQDHPGFVDGG